RRKQPHIGGCGARGDRVRESFHIQYQDGEHGEPVYLSALELYIASCWSLVVPFATAALFSVLPVALYLHVAYGKPPFCCQTSKVGCTFRRKPPAPGSPLPAPCWGGLPVLLHTVAPDQSPAPALEARHTQPGQHPAQRNISVPVPLIVSGSAPWQQ